MDMPVLQPIPIPTKGVGALRRIWRWFTFSRKWKVVEDYVFPIDGGCFVIPAGFIFDGASIPRIFWTVLSPTGLLLIPGLIHDFGYRYNYLLEQMPEGSGMCFKGAGKVFWDKLFLRIGEQVNGVHFVNHVAWLALVLGGWWAWKTNRKRNASAVYDLVG